MNQELGAIQEQYQFDELSLRALDKVGNYNHRNEVILENLGETGRDLTKSLAFDLLANRHNPEYFLRLDWASLSGTGKSRSIEEVIHHLNRTLNSRSLLRAGALPIHFYYRNLIEDIEMGRWLEDVTSPLGQISDKEYWLIQARSEKIWGLAERHLPGPALAINDTLAMRGHTISRNRQQVERVGAPRLNFADLKHRAANRHNVRVVFQSTDYSQLGDNVNFRDKVINTPLVKIPALIKGRGLIDLRDPQEIVRSYRLSGNRKSLAQQVEGSILDLFMYQSAGEIQVLPPTESYDQFNSQFHFLMETEPNLLTKYLGEDLYPAMLHGIFGENVSKYGWILRTDFKVGINHPIQENLLKAHSLKEALVTMSYQSNPDIGLLMGLRELRQIAA